MSFSKHRLYVLSATIILFCTAVNVARADIAAIRSEDNAVFGSLGGSYYNYKEYNDDGSSADTERGWLPDLKGGISYLGADNAKGLARNLYLEGDGLVDFSTANYNGHLLFTGAPAQGTTKETIWEMNGRIGRGFPIGKYVMLIPYGQVGYRYWDRNLGQGQVEDYDNVKLMGGLMAQVAPTSSLVLSMSMAGGQTISPKMNAKDINADFTLTEKPIWEGELKAGYALSQHLEMFGAFDYTQFSYGRSGLVTGNDGNQYFEPNSKTKQYTSRLGLAYRYN